MTDPVQPSEFAEAERRAEVQFAVSRVLSEATSINEAVEAILPALATALGWDYAAIWFPNGSELHCAATWTHDDAAVRRFAEASRAWRFTGGEGLPGRCWTERRAIWLSAVQRDESLPRVAIAREAHLFGAIAFPIVEGDAVTGVIECFTRDREVVTPQLLALTEGVGRQFGHFLRRLNAEQRLADNERRYAAIVQGALDAIVAIDEDGRVLEFNPAAERLFGYRRDEAVGREMAELIVPPAVRDGHRAGLRRHRESGQSALLQRRIELPACRRDGSEFLVELTISRIAVGGRWSFLGFLRDITDRRAHEQEREELAKRERAAYDAAVAASAVKDEFLAALSHELRTPLNAILGWSAMLAKRIPEPDRFAQIAETIRRNAEVQQRLVEDMLDLSTFLSGRVRIDAQQLQVDQPVKAACETVQPAAAARRVRITVAVPPVAVVGDRTRLQQVFWNLLTNAIKFTPAGGEVRVAGEAAASTVTISISDSGQGIEPDFLPWVFERFRQGRSARQPGSLGLGLALVKQIVEAHGGAVSAHSDGPGRGATFRVVLPLPD